eukprot:g16728.t1
MEENADDEIAVGVAEDVRMPNLVAVELPLAVKPTELGIQAGLSLIGGIEELSKVTADEEKALKLHARPKDPLCRPLVAQRSGPLSNSFVFKVKRRRLRPKGGPEEEGGGGGGVDGGDTKWSIASVEAVGAVHTNFTFHSLADAQFLSCRPKDVGAEESVDEHIEAAALRTEPMELVPASFLPSFTKVSQQSREEKLLRREKKHHAYVKIERGGLLVYHRFGEAVKHRTKNGSKLLKDAKEVVHMRDQLEQKWGAGRQRGRKYRPSRYRTGITGHNEVREQQLLLVQKLDKLFEKQPMYFMRQIEHLLSDQPVWPIRDLVPAVAYYFCNGPWRSRWVRFGYRPEDHPTDRFEQLLEFRVSPTQLRLWADALDRKPNAPKTSTHTAAPTSPAAAPAAAPPTAAPPAGSATATPPAVESGNTTSNASRTASAGGANPEEHNPPTCSEQNRSKPPEDSSTGVGVPAAGAEEDNPEEGEGVQVAEAEREEEEDGAAGRTEGGQEQGDDDSVTPGFGAGGVVPDLWLTSKTKGRFACQLVANGAMLSARNRVLIRESPIREVQELALKSSRLDRPGIVTGWWPQSTIDKFRMLTLDGLSSVVKFKKEQLAATAEHGGKPSGSSTSTNGGASAAKNTALRPNMTREEFDKAMKVMEKRVKVVKAPTAAAVAAAGSVGGGDAAYPARKSKGFWPGTGARSGTGRVGGAKKVAGSKRPAPGSDSGGGGGGDAVVADALRNADAATVRSGGDSEQETETDSVNSSELVDDSEEDSWDSQDDELSDEDEDRAEDDDEDEDEQDEKDAAADKGTADKRPRTQQPPDGSVAAAGGTAAGRQAAALPRKGGGSRNKERKDAD